MKFAKMITSSVAHDDNFIKTVTVNMNLQISPKYMLCVILLVVFTATALCSTTAVFSQEHLEWLTAIGVIYEDRWDRQAG